MSEEQQIKELERQIEEREAKKKRMKAAQNREAFWKDEVQPVMWLFVIVALFIMLSQCSVIRISL